VLSPADRTTTAGSEDSGAASRLGRQVASSSSQALARLLTARGVGAKLGLKPTSLCWFVTVASEN
jgi:hypothetical protein